MNQDIEDWNISNSPSLAEVATKENIKFKNSLGGNFSDMDIKKAKMNEKVTKQKMKN